MDVFQRQAARRKLRLLLPGLFWALWVSISFGLWQDSAEAGLFVFPVALFWLLRVLAGGK